MISDAPGGHPADEWRALDAARDAARADVGAARAAVAAGAGEAEAAIFDAHLPLLDDDALLDPARRAIDDEGRNAAQARSTTPPRPPPARTGTRTTPYLRERAADVRDVGRRVLGHLAGTGAGPATIAGAGCSSPTS